LVQSTLIFSLTQLTITIQLGNIGVGSETNGEDDELLFGSRSLLFLFPRTQPAVLLRITLADFDNGDVVLLQFGNDRAIDDQQRKREIDGTLTLIEQSTDAEQGWVSS
jgi:hypothetical protein